MKGEQKTGAVTPSAVEVTGCGRNCSTRTVPQQIYLPRLWLANSVIIQCVAIWWLLRGADSSHAGSSMKRDPSGFLYSNPVLLSRTCVRFLYILLKAERVRVRLLACLLLCNYIHCHCSEQQKGLEHIKACGCEGVGEACLPQGQTCPCLSSAFFWGEILSPSKARNRKYHEEEQEERWASPKVDRWKIKRRVE